MSAEQERRKALKSYFDNCQKMQTGVISNEASATITLTWHDLKRLELMMRTREFFACEGCGRPEAVCSANPCAAVLEDRRS